MKRLACLAAGLFLALRLAAAAVPPPAAIFVDTTDAHRGVFHTHITIPAKAGPMTLVYPKWIPGEHMPTGPLMQMAGLHFHAGGAELRWTRDPVDMFAFHVDLPPGSNAVEIDFDFLSASKTFGDGYGESANATQNLLDLLFNHVVLYEAGIPTDQLIYRASVKLPSGWGFDTALPVSGREGDEVDFEPVSLTTLVDSPLIAGKYLRTIPIADNGREHVTIVADSSRALDMSDASIDEVRRLVAETDALFGARHYRTYRWLITLSDLVELQGLEHHESTDIRLNERALTEPDWTNRSITILAHEFVHSWNGKYRRPAGLATPDYQAPMRDELLYVYEGMTRYMGDFLLSARTGMRTMEQDREYAAWVAANQDRNRPGRNWRPLADTAVSVPSLGTAPSEDVPYRRSFDYYDESMLVWLDADVIIRRKSGGTKSFDDFAKLFFGPPSTAPEVKPYTLDDVVAALDRVAPADWRSFIESRVYRVAPHPPIAALEAAGWRLVYTDTPNWYESMRERTNKEVDESFSAGLWVGENGTIKDVVYGSAAWNAGLMPGMKITSIDGRTFAADVLHQEIRAAKGTARPIDVSIEQGSFAGTFHLDAHDGELYPHLERIDGAQDLLQDILRPHTR